MKPIAFFAGLMICLMYCEFCYAQNDNNLKWFNPQTNTYNTLKGKAWQIPIVPIIIIAYQPQQKKRYGKKFGI